MVKMVKNNKKNDYLVRADDDIVAQELGLSVKKTKKITKKVFEKIDKTKYETCIWTPSLMSKGKNILWIVKKLTRWDKIRRWFMDRGLGSHGGWHISYRWKTKKWNRELNLSARHWNGMFSSLFKIFRLHKLDLWNFHLFSMYYNPPDYMVGQWCFSITIFNFDMSLYKNRTEDEK